MEKLEKVEETCKRWLFPKRNLDLDNIYEKIKEIDFTPLILSFTSRLETIPCSFSKSEQVSGSICFFGGIFTSLQNYGYIREIEGLFTFAACYMLIDHFLDNNEISSIEKNQTMREIYNFIHEEDLKKENKGNIKGKNKIINAVADRYLDLIKRVPECKKHIIQLFDSELKGVEIQKNKNLKREDYQKIAHEKGGWTSACIASIIGLSVEGDNFNLGSIIQLVDDLIDIKDDTNLEIYTLVRYDYDRGYLDNYIFETIEKINEISPLYNFFRIILLSGITLGVRDNPGCVSPPLEQILSHYTPFTTSKEEITEWFHRRLYEYIDEKI
jgi:hypothetical protein